MLAIDRMARAHQRYDRYGHVKPDVPVMTVNELADAAHRAAAAQGDPTVDVPTASDAEAVTPVRPSYEQWLTLHAVRLRGEYERYVARLGEAQDAVGSTSDAEADGA